MKLQPIIAASLFALCDVSLAAQVAPPMGSSPTPGAGLNYDARAHDGATDFSVVDDVDKAVRNKAGQQADLANGRSDRTVAAVSSDLKPGAGIFDRRGQLLGNVEGVDSLSVTVATSAGRVAVPAEAFGKNRRGLMLELTKKQFDELVTSTTAAK